jgi:aliphatic nitrilase
MVTTTYRVASVQAEPVWLDAAGTLEKTLELIAEAADAGAKLIAFPEVWFPGYPFFLWLDAVANQMPMVARYHRSSLATDGPEMLAIRAAARSHEIAVVLGFSERDRGTLYISQTAIGADGDILFHRRKLKPTHVERSLFGEGDGSDLVVVDTDLGRLGALSCAEHLQPLSKFALYAQHEQLHVASWPCFSMYRNIAHALSPEANMAATATYALEGGCFVIASTQVISDAGVALFAPRDEQKVMLPAGGGFSRVYGPDGAQLSEGLPEDQEGLVYAEIDLDMIAIAKNAFDPAGHYSRGDVTRLLLDPRRRSVVVRPGSTEAAGPYFPELGD